MHHVRHRIVITLLLLVAGMVAYGGVTRHFAHDGGSAGGFAWPSPNQVLPLYKGGAYPGLSGLRQIRAGMNKYQVASLIGYPHFHEDARDTREWNYVFHLPMINGGSMLCQYKVLFDEDKLVRGFYWKSASCAGLLGAGSAEAGSRRHADALAVGK